MELFRRKSSLKMIRGLYHAADSVNVITGARRCGKSRLMQLVADERREGGARENQIVFLVLTKE